MNFQRVKSEHLIRYSANAKVNSILRALIAFHGYKNIFSHVVEYVLSNENRNPKLSEAETWELYQAAKWAQYFKE